MNLKLKAYIILHTTHAKMWEYWSIVLTENIHVYVCIYVYIKPSHTHTELIDFNKPTMGG